MERLLGWFRRGRGSGAPSGFPTMLRVRDASGTLVPQVLLEGVFEPSGRSMQKTQITASGLCLVHWPRDAIRLVLQVSAGADSAEIEVNQSRPEPSRVIEVQLS